MVIHTESDLIIDEADVKVRDASQLVTVNQFLQGFCLLPILNLLHFIRQIDETKSWMILFIFFEPVINFVSIDLKTINAS